jgi:RimJ/RimL family protein N-acetyltransferase
MSSPPDRAVDVDLRPWRRDDLELMHRLLGDPAMTAHLGGPESPEQLRSRLERYVTMPPDSGRVFVITAGPDREPAGSVVFWPHVIRDEPALEIGWGVLPVFQGRGIATRATARCLEIAAAETEHRTIHAFPSVDNAASNAVCRKQIGRARGSSSSGPPSRSSSSGSCS